MTDTPSEANSSESLFLRLGIVALAILLGSVVAWLPAQDQLSAEGQRLAAVGLVMAILWCTQVVPLAVTSLVPLMAFPFLGIQTADVVSKSYMNSTILLYFSGFAIAIGVERWGLHKRIALWCLSILGTGPKQIVLGFMLGTGFLSMWISNTAATLLMLPIAVAVLGALATSAGQEDAAASGTASGTLSPEVQASHKRLAVALLLGIAYASSIGGMSTLIGTPTNGVYAGYWSSARDSMEEIQRYSVSSGQWLVMFFPITLAMMAVTWFVLCLPIMRGFSLGNAAREEIQARYQALGRMLSGERRMLGVFLAVALLWLTRVSIDFGGFVLPGWEDGLTAVMQRLSPGFSYQGWLHDSTAGLVMMGAMFLIPAREESTGKTVFLMDWETIEAKTPWGILLLFGGGFALASACTTTGLSAWLGTQIAAQIEPMNDTFKVMSVASLVIFLTEFTSNTATISTLLPILDDTARALALDPRLLMLPATIAASCAFMLPIATPPNAIVFSSNRLTVRQMLFTGLWLNLLGILIITFFTMTWVLQVQQIS